MFLMQTRRDIKETNYNRLDVCEEMSTTVHSVLDEVLSNVRR